MGTWHGGHGRAFFTKAGSDGCSHGPASWICRPRDRPRGVSLETGAVLQTAGTRGGVWVQSIPHRSGGGPSETDLLGPDQHQVVAGLRTGVAAAGQDQQAGLPAGGAGARVAPVMLSAQVVAGRGGPEDRGRPGHMQNPTEPQDGDTVYLHGSLQRGGLVVFSRPHGTSRTVDPQEQLSSTISGHG